MVSSPAYAHLEAARNWGLHPDGILQRNKLITTQDSKRLEVWIDTVERTAVGLLVGLPPHDEVQNYAQYIVDVGWWDNIDFFIPLMDRAVSDLENFDGIENVVRALGKVGARARSVLPTLYEAMNRKYSWSTTPDERRTREVGNVIRQAIQNIEGGG
jgi:hypothetical protein